MIEQEKGITSNFSQQKPSLSESLSEATPEHKLEYSSDNESQKRVESLVDEFRLFMQQEGVQGGVNGEREQAMSVGTTQEGSVTLFNLFTELAALKSEVKRESMQVKEAVGQFSGLLDTLRNNNQQLSNELEQRNKQEAVTLFSQRLPIIEDLLDLNDNLERTLSSLTNYQPSWWERRSRQGLAFREDIINGLEITSRRIKKSLRQYEIEPIKCKNKNLNPHCMKVVKVEENELHPDGIVLDVLRKGYRRHGEVIRLAEVVVSKAEKIKIDKTDTEK